MLDGTHHFECACHSDEHTLIFTLDRDDRELYTRVFLNDWWPWWMRIWIAIKYVFGYKCKYGHWDCWIMRPEDALRLREMLDTFIGDALPHPQSETPAWLMQVRDLFKKAQPVGADQDAMHMLAPYRVELSEIELHGAMDVLERASRYVERTVKRDRFNPA